MLNASDVISISRQIKAGAQYENPRRELKREFWKIEDNEGKSEFVKDLTAMANTPGPDAYFIIGIDGDTGEINNAVLPLDTAKLTDIIYSKVQEPFDCEFYEVETADGQIVIVHIPQSFNKPHVIKSHKNIQSYIPIRKGTRTNPATRYDLDLMYNERNKNVVIPFKLEPFIGGSAFRLKQKLNSVFSVAINLINSGTSINFMYSSNLHIIDNKNDKTYIGNLYAFHNDLYSHYIEELNQSYLSIKPDEILIVTLDYVFTKTQMLYLEERFKDDEPLSAFISVTDRKNNIEYSKNLTFILN